MNSEHIVRGTCGWCCSCGFYAGEDRRALYEHIREVWEKSKK